MKSLKQTINEARGQAFSKDDFQSLAEVKSDFDSRNSEDIEFLKMFEQVEKLLGKNDKRIVEVNSEFVDDFKAFFDFASYLETVKAKKTVQTKAEGAFLSLYSIDGLSFVYSNDDNNVQSFYLDKSDIAKFNAVVSKYIA